MSDFPIPEAFSVRTEQHGDAAVVVPTGELDLATAPALEDALGRAFDGGSGRVVLDLRELEFIDSSGLRTLLTARRRAEEAGRAVLARRRPPRPRAHARDRGRAQGLRLDARRRAGLSG